MEQWRVWEGRAWETVLGRRRGMAMAWALGRRFEC